MANKKVVGIQKLDESVTDNIDTNQNWYIIMNSDKGGVLADAPYLKKWLMENGLDELLAVSGFDVVAAKWTVEFDIDDHALVARTQFSPELIFV